MKKNSRWWVWVICITLPLLVCGFAWNARKTGIAAAIGGGVVIFGGLGSTFAPTANSKAYYDRRTGRRVTADGKPWYSLTEDTQAHGTVLGLLWFVIKFIGQLIGGAIMGAYAGMAIYGVYAAVRLVISIWK